jgi:hypothetical protein
MKEILLNELPEFVEHIDEATDRIFNPSSIWIEAVQFADYVGQLAIHLKEEHGADSREEIADRLTMMSESFKQLAEHAMLVIDQLESRQNGSQQ